MSDEELCWIDEASERPAIEAVRASLGSQLEGLPADLCDDLQIARFLRGRENDPEQAAEVMAQGVAYRRELIATEPFKALRSKIADAESVDMRLLPHADRMLTLIPLRILEGCSINGLPMMINVARLMDLDACEPLINEETFLEDFKVFLKGLLEQRAVVLHNISHKQHRMAKFVDVRDANQIGIAKILRLCSSHSMKVLGTMKELFTVVQDYYPELIHKVVAFNIPDKLATVINLFSSLLNDRMRSKIRILPIGAPFDEMSGIMQAGALWSWVDFAARGAQLDFSSLIVPEGSQEYTVRWLEKGQTCNWVVTCLEGPDVGFLYAFLSSREVGGAEGRKHSCEEVKVYNGSPHEGSWTATEAGVLWLCINNVFSWFTPKTISLSFD